MVAGAWSIRSLTTRVLSNPHFDPAGHHVGRVQMILGLLCKAQKKRAPAMQHLTEARNILLQFGQPPILAGRNGSRGIGIAARFMPYETTDCTL
jgi:hypothetical protein